MYVLDRNGTCMRETRQVQCPTLVVHGAKDEYFEMEDPEYFVQNIPDARLVAADHTPSMLCKSSLTLVVAAPSMPRSILCKTSPMHP